MPAFTDKELIHEGNYAKVYKCLMTSKDDQRKIVAVKHARRLVLEKTHIPKYTKTGASMSNALHKLDQEIAILQKIKGLPGIANLDAILRDTDNISLVFEWAGYPIMSWNDVEKKYKVGEEVKRLLPAIDLNEHRQEGCFSEKEAKHIIQKILCAVESLHKIGIVHKDIKPDNILISADPSNHEPIITVIDFSSADDTSHMGPKDLGNIYDSQGTIHFSPPEMYRPWERIDSGLERHPYDGFKKDLWSIGMTLLVMLTGSFPFDPTLSGLRLELTIGSLNAIPLPTWFSGKGQEFLCRLLQTNAPIRATVSEALSHPWLEK